ncbi:hypothetical protein GCM10027038_20670 [Arthrobacter bambusae]
MDHMADFRRQFCHCFQEYRVKAGEGFVPFRQGSEFDQAAPKPPDLTFIETVEGGVVDRATRRTAPTGTWLPEHPPQTWHPTHRRLRGSS